MPVIEKQVTVANKKGIHARPAALFVQLVEKLNVAVTVVKGSEQVNGKSIMGLLMLGAQNGAVLKLIVDGDQAEQALAALETFLSKQEEEFLP